MDPNAVMQRIPVAAKRLLPIQFAAARVAATFTLVEFCHGGAGDETRGHLGIAGCKANVQGGMPELTLTQDRL